MGPLFENINGREEDGRKDNLTKLGPICFVASIISSFAVSPRWTLAGGSGYCACTMF